MVSRSHLRLEFGHVPWAADQRAPIQHAHDYALAQMAGGVVAPALPATRIAPLRPWPQTLDHLLAYRISALINMSVSFAGFEGQRLTRSCKLTIFAGDHFSK
jgi:hypothetical protein